MKLLANVGAVCLLAGCSAPHAARVRCDAHLAPINSAAVPSAAPLASTRAPRDVGDATASVDPRRGKGAVLEGGAASAESLVP